MTPEAVQGFLSDHGRAFYGVTNPGGERVALRKADEVIADSVRGGAVEVVNFRRGKPTWSLEWK